MITAVLVALCGGIGALARFGVDDFVQQRRLGSYPLGTLVVNLSGAFLLGLLVGLHTSHRIQLVVGTATIGSYTTFSTWILEAHRAAEDGQPDLAWQSIVVALVAGVAAAALGRGVAGLL